MTLFLDSDLNPDKVTYVAIYDIARFYTNNKELCIEFKNTHRYNSMEEIIDILKSIGISIDKFTFCGVNSSSYKPDTPKDDYSGGETHLLAVIPKTIKDSFSILIGE